MSSSKFEVTLQTALIVGILYITTKAIIKHSTFTGLNRIYSPIDKETYYVRHGPHQDGAVNMLSRIRSSLIRLYEKVMISNPEQAIYQKGLYMLKLRYPTAEHIRVYELDSSKYSEIAFNQNKRDGIFICLRSDLSTMQIADFETLMFISIHEMAHSMQQETAHIIDGVTSHDAEFDAFNDYLIYEALQLGLLSTSRMTPKMHCGSMVGTVQM